jgi:hypothetical protein
MRVRADGATLREESRNTHEFRLIATAPRAPEATPAGGTSAVRPPSPRPATLSVSPSSSLSDAWPSCILISSLRLSAAGCPIR